MDEVLRSPEDAGLYAELRERLRFETLIADLSSTFVNLPAADVDREVTEALRLFCELLSLDLAGFWQWSDEAGGSFKLTHLYRVERGPELPEPMIAHEHFPWFEQQILAGRIVAVSSVDELPAEAARDLEVGRQLGIKSNLTLPLSVGGEPPLGALGFNTTRAARDWLAPLVKRLQLVAQIFANALARKRTDQALRGSEARMAAGADLAGLGYYEMDFAEPSCFIDERFHEICGVAPGRQPGLQPLEEWMEHLHPDDRPRMLEVRRELHEGKLEQVSTEYRYMHPVEGQKWIHQVARVALRDAAGHTLRSYGVIRDITSRKLAEKEAQELRDNLAHLARVNTLGFKPGSLSIGSTCRSCLTSGSRWARRADSGRRRRRCLRVNHQVDRHRLWPPWPTRWAVGYVEIVSTRPGPNTNKHGKPRMMTLTRVALAFGPEGEK